MVNCQIKPLSNSLFAGFEYCVECNFVGYEDFARHGTSHWPHDAEGFKLVHDASCAVVAEAHLALDERRASLLVDNDEACCFLEHAVEWSRIAGAHAAIV